MSNQLPSSSLSVPSAWMSFPSQAPSIPSTPEKELLQEGWPKETVDKFMARIEISKGPILAIDNLSRSFNGKKILQGVSINIFPGEIFGIVGISGSGKTTLLQTIAGIDRPSSGSVKLNDLQKGALRSIHGDSSLKSWIGFSPQAPSLFPELTVRENLANIASILDLPAQRFKYRLDQLSISLGISNILDERVSSLSKGLQKKVDIAAAVLPDPSLLILDEPARDLDPLSRKTVYQALRSLNDAGTTIILSSHAISELSELCTRVGVLHEGRILKSVRPEDISQAFYNISFKTDSTNYAPYLERLSQAAIPSTATSEGLRIRTTEPELVIRFLLDSAQARSEKILDLAVTRPTVNDMFEGLVRP